ncbi:hypothetical protein LCGC14_0887040 [marine sediment metagenome]|uniref:Uncharacterized protein n=1 Tax=marine sediment metagenome TaxID=412755 RepID=A0A0F9S773_9ZZZZ
MKLTQESKPLYYYLYDMSLLETLEFVFRDEIVVEYRSDMIIILDNNGHPFFDNDRETVWHRVAGK